MGWSGKPAEWDPILRCGPAERSDYPVGRTRST